MPTTSIEWTDKAWPVVNGCRRVSPGCENCWAERLTATRLRHHPRYKGLAIYTENGPRWTGERRMALDLLDEPLRTKKPAKWFVANKGDLFGEGVTNEQIAAVFGVMAACPHHTFQVLTKRPARMVEWFKWIADQGAELLGQVGEQPTAAGGEVASACAVIAGEKATGGALTDDGWRAAMAAPWPLPNVWIGVSVEDQQRADERIPLLLECPAAVRWLSVEPLLGPVDLGRWMGDFDCHACHARFWSDGFVSHGCRQVEFAPNPTKDDPEATRYECPACGMTDCGTGDVGAVGESDYEGEPRLNWIVVGGESGPNARPCAIEWIQSMMAQCRAASVACFVKQMGAYVASELRTAPRHLMGDRDYQPEDFAPSGEIWAWRAVLTDKKGADVDQWKELRTRQFPRTAGEER